MTTKSTVPKQLTPFKPGQSGNPAGRPKGSRNKLGEAFLKALQEDFDENGVAAIVKVRDEKPEHYLKIIAGLLPKEMNLNINDQYGDLTDDEIIDRIRQLSEGIAPFLIDGTGKSTIDIEGEAIEGQPAKVH